MKNFLLFYVLTFSLTGFGSRVVSGSVNCGSVVNATQINVTLSNPSSVSQDVTVKLYTSGDAYVYDMGPASEPASGTVTCSDKLNPSSPSVYRNCSATSKTIPAKSSFHFSVHVFRAATTNLLTGVAYEVTVDGSDDGYISGHVTTGHPNGSLAYDTAIAGGRLF